MVKPKRSTKAHPEYRNAGISMPHDLHRRARERAEAERRSLSSLVQLAVEAYLDRTSDPRRVVPS